MLGTLSEADLAPICESSDVGLALMPMQSDDDNLRHMAGASNKVFEYLLYGVAPLVSDLPDWRNTFVDAGYALACDPSDARSIAGTLGLALKNRDAVRAVAERGYERLCADWNYESQFAPVLEAMITRRASTLRRAALEDRQEAQCAF